MGISTLRFSSPSPLLNTFRMFASVRDSEPSDSVRITRGRGEVAAALNVLPALVKLWISALKCVLGACFEDRIVGMMLCVIGDITQEKSKSNVIFLRLS